MAAQIYTQAQWAQLLAGQQQQAAYQPGVQYRQAASSYQPQYVAKQYVAQQYAAQQYPAQQYTAQPYAAQQYAAQQYVPQQQQQRTVQLALPEDAFPGKSYEFDAPDGTVKSFVVPQGYGPGMPIVVSY